MDAIAGWIEGYPTPEQRRTAKIFQELAGVWRAAYNAQDMEQSRLSREYFELIAGQLEKRATELLRGTWE